jgi:hypothetical protein
MEKAREGRSAVEMTGPWKTWKTRRRFPRFPTAPWKSPTARFPHSHRAGDGSKIKRTGKKACRNGLRQGISYVFWVGFLMAGFEVTPYGRF